ncbi:hypothetical protein BGZ76_008474 [Entomortierella beljakovae]|nr:hypothetical protein BGZ76_008474 [Entomortierella beljakovae]
MALSGHGSIQGETGPKIQPQSSLGSPTSSGRTSLDLDNTPINDNGNNKSQGHAAAHLSHDALNQGYYERFFVEQRKLGRGFRGSVFLCQHVLDGIYLGEYAIKKVAVGDNHEWLVQMLREVHLLERLHHPNIVSYKHAWLENHQLHKFGPEVTCLFILMECANGGNLEEYVEHLPEVSLSVDPDDAAIPRVEVEPDKPLSAKERLQSKRQRLQSTMSSSKLNSSESEKNTSSTRHLLSITEIWSFFFDICEGLAHLHKLGIIHRDLKPPNLLLSYSSSQVKGSKGERPRILITDFGECEILDQAAKRDRTGATGTLEFLAPELLAVDAEGRYTNEFSFKGDMWSLDDEQGDRIIPDELKILIRVLLSPEKSKRPSCDDILTTLSPQRERMMRGDMDSPATPIRASSNLAYEDVEPIANSNEINELEEADESKDDLDYHSSNKKQVAPVKSNNNRPQHRQNYHIVRRNSVKSPGRRLSRTTLASEGPSKSSISHGSTSLASTARVHTASPSVHLHKKVKPLGLGLRHMLRRKMNHPAVTSSNTASYNPWSVSSHKGAQGFNLAGLYPLALVASNASSESGSIVARSPSTHVGATIAKHQEFQYRKQGASRKESALGSSVVLPPNSGGPESSRSDPGSENAASTTSKRVVTMENQISNPQRKKTRRDKQAQSIESSEDSSRINGLHGSSASFDGNDNGDIIGRSIHSRIDGSALSQSRSALGKSHWDRLASTHAREMSQSNSVIATDASGDFASESSEDSDSLVIKGMHLGGGGTRRRSQTKKRSSLEADRQDQTSRIRPRHGVRGHELSADYSHHQHPLQHHRRQHQHQHQQPQQPQQQAHMFLLQDFSFHFMFLGLIARVWLCLSICSPLMVRPVVLYPVLLLAAVWDRYSLSLISEKIKSSKFIENYRRGSASNSSGLRVTDGTNIAGSFPPSPSTPPEAGMRKRSSRQSFDSIKEDSGTDADADSDPLSEGRDRSYLVAKDRNNGHNLHTHNPVPIWQAFVSGILLQLLWIGFVWLFSQDGLCSI